MTTDEPTTDETVASSDQPPAGAVELAAVVRAAGARHAFGPDFFLVHLAAFVRDRCPEEGEHLPRVDLVLADGQSIRICHVIALGPRWVAVAARDDDRRDDRMVMRTEILPYELIARVSIAAGADHGRGIGFDRNRQAVIVADAQTPEQAFLAAAGQRPAARSP
ncbi:MAG TPA: hypothetical protein VHE35_09890 [Kofleriaceae bacterium]|nr:hypothetical protein [Kofleriaceae bacterium]